MHSACAARVFDLIEEPVEKPDAESAKVLEKADGSVELSHVYFSYTPEQKLIEGFQPFRTAGTARGNRRAYGLR